MNHLNYKPKPFILLLPFVVFFVLGTFYLYRFTGYMFFYQEKASLFLVGSTYLHEHLTQPGGFLKYLSDFQTAFYYYPFLGALFNTLEICGIIFLLSKIGFVLSGRRFYFLPFLMGAVLYFLQINYQYEAANNIGVFIALVLFLFAISSKNRKSEWIYVILFPAVYFLCGGFSFVFLGLMSTYFLLQKQWQKLVCIWLFGGIFFYVGKEILFMQKVEDVIRYPFSIEEIGGQIRLFVVVVCVLVLFPVFTRFEIKKVGSVSVKRVRLIELTPWVVVLILAFVLIPRIDKKANYYFHVEKLFYEQKYEEIVRLNKQFWTDNMLTSFLNNIALAETGYLSDSFFQFRQSPDGRTLLLSWDNSVEILQHGRYFYYTIGMINEAQRWTYEAEMLAGFSPEGLKMLIKTDLIKGKYEIAEKYISILEKSIFYRGEAKNLRTFLYNDKAIAMDKDLGRKRLLDTKQDFFVHPNMPAADLDDVIKADPTNIAAIEYKLALLMLQKNIEGIVNMLPLMEKAGYTRIPKNVEEVVVAYKMLNMGELPTLEKLQISPQALERFQYFSKIFEKYRGNKKQAKKELANGFRDTFWYYMFYA
jgi:hypothetical protein